VTVSTALSSSSSSEPSFARSLLWAAATVAALTLCVGALWAKSEAQRPAVAAAAH
jgi:hypothetical protein